MTSLSLSWLYSLFISIGTDITFYLADSHRLSRATVSSAMELVNVPECAEAQQECIKSPKESEDDSGSFSKLPNNTAKASSLFLRFTLACLCK